MITDDRLSKALTYLAQTDEPCAKAKSKMMALEDITKTILGYAFGDLEGAAEVRRQGAYTSVEYQTHVASLEEARIEYETMRNKRMTESLIVEVWRSEQANRRHGNV